MIFETHAHYDDKAFDDDREELLRKLPEEGIKYVVNVAANMEGSKKNLEIINKFNYFFGTVGVHPCDTTELNEKTFKELEEMSKHEKIVAIGEIGLDYYWDEPDRNIQKEWFVKQIELAKKVGKPIVVHSRDAAKDTLEIIKNPKAYEIGGVIQCVSYGVEMAREYLNMGYYIGVGGVVTFNNGRKLKEVVEYAPLERIVLETDCPYLAPVPFRGKRNDSTKLSYVVDAIAEIKNVDREMVMKTTMKNACDMYRIELK